MGNQVSVQGDKLNKTERLTVDQSRRFFCLIQRYTWDLQHG